MNDPAQDLYLALRRDQDDAVHKAALSFATPWNAQNLVDYSNAYPLGSAELGVGVTMAGIPGNSRDLNPLVQQEMMETDVNGPVKHAGGGWWDDLAGVWDEWVDNPLKGATRWGFSAWDAAYNMLAGGAPIRAHQQAQTEGTSFNEAWQEQDPYFFEALGGLFAGEQVNLGSGWLPSSDVATDVREGVNTGMMEVERATEHLGTNEKYVKRLEAAPGVWENAVAGSVEQKEMGKPLTELAATAAESVMFDVSGMAGNVKTPWSPGRIAAAHILEPGSEPFAKVSGFGDFASQMFLDPADWIGIGWAKAGLKGRTVAAQADKVAKQLGPRGPTRAFDADEAAYGFKTIEQLDVPIDPSLAQMEQLKISTGGAPLHPYESAPAADGLPAWSDPELGRNLGPGDPPEFYVDDIQSQLEAARRAKATQKVQKVEAGFYTMADEAGNPIHIQKVDGKWLVTDETGKVISEGHKTLKGASASVAADFDAAKAGTDFNGMSIDEFQRTGEDLVLDDGVEVLTNQVDEFNGRATDAPIHKASKSGKGNTKVRVYGKTADGTKQASKLDEGLQAALRKDRKVRNGFVVGFGNPNVEKWGATKAWMRENGYGKLKLDNDRYLILDEYVGGNKADPYGRSWQVDGSQPISSLSVGDDVMGSRVTADEVNNIIDWIIENGATKTKRQVREAAQVGDVSVAEAEKIRLALKQSDEARTALQGVRPDFDELATTNSLNGKRSGMLIDRITSATKKGGQTSPRILDDLLKVFERKGVVVPIDLRRSLYEAGSREEVQVRLAQWLANEGGGSVLLRGGGGMGGYGRLAHLTDVADETLGMKITSQIGKTVGSPMGTARAMIPGVSPRSPRTSITDKPWLARRIAYGLPSEPINMVENPDKTYQVLNEILPNFNLNRGSVVELYDDAGKSIGETKTVEELFERLRQNAGNKDVAYDLMGEFSEVFFSQLVADGVDAGLAKHAKRWWGEVKKEAIYEAERLGMTGISPGQGDLALVGEHQIHGLGPQLTAQAWDGTMHFPDNKTIRHIANESDKLGQLANKFTSKLEVDEVWGGMNMVDRTWKRYADFTMNSVWKPLVLLRAAWTIRIAIDDQLRIAGDGYGLFRHPWRVIQYGTTMPKDWWTLFKKGQMDINGELMSIDNISNLMHEDALRKAVMQKGGDAKLGPGSNGFRHTTSVGRGAGGKPPAKYINGLTTDIKQLRASTVTKVLASSKSDDAVGETVEFLLGRGPKRTQASGLKARQELGHIYSRMSDPKDPQSVKAKILAGSDEELLREVVEKQWATLHQKTGGKVYLDNGDGVALNYGTFDMKPGMKQGTPQGRATWVVETSGDEDLLKVVAGDNKLYGDLNSDESMKALEGALGTKVKANPETYPKIVRVTDETRAMYPDNLQDTYSKGLRTFFDWFMAKPSDMLSRQPLFRRAYHQRMGDMYPYMDDALQKQYRKTAGTADIKYAEAQTKAAGKLDIGGQITSLEQADGLAKAYGLSQVETTLFRVLDSKRNISEALNLIFPFVEAWGEFMSRWGRIMVTGDKAMKNARRFQQGIEGARDSGFFYENEYGQEVFNYPAFMTKAQIKVHNMLNDIPIAGSLLGENIDPAVEEAVTQGGMFKPADAGTIRPSSVTGNVESMNFASSVIPGFGPVFQMGAKQILPDDPKWDSVKEMISPFGSEGSVAGSLMPAWLKRISASLGGGNDPQLAYQYTATVQDVINTQINSGQWENVTTQAQVTEMVKKAEDQAQAFLLVRAAATYWTPTSPQYKFQTQDTDGMIWSYTNLGNEYYKIKEEAGGDEGAAFEEFTRRFGMLPSAFAGPGRTYDIEPRSRSDEGYKFERANPALFDAYPGTAMYLDPNVGLDSEYNHDATLRQLKLGQREAWTGEQLIYLKQDQLGDIMWENVTKGAQNDKAAGIKAGVIDGKRTASREEIKSLYPYWNEKIPGKVQSYTSEQKMAEVMQWMDDPDIAGTPIAEAARRYLFARDEALRVIADIGGKTLSSTSSTSEQGMASIQLREMLRDTANTLSLKTPEFAELFKAVFAYEVRSDIDGPTIAEPTFGSSQTIFDDHLGNESS